MKTKQTAPSQMTLGMTLGNASPLPPDDDRPPLPEGWVWTTIGKVSDTTSGGTPSRKHPEYYTDGTIPWIKSGELKDGFIIQVEESITEEALKKSSAKIFPQGTPVVALYGATVGKTGILGLDAATNQAVCAIFALKEAFIAKNLSENSLGAVFCA